jgi:hypothetical protein
VIRSLGHNVDGKQIVLLGLEPQNLDRLREGQPVRVNLRHLDPGGNPLDELPDIDVVIFFAGKDETAWIKAAYERRPQ